MADPLGAEVRSAVAAVLKKVPMVQKAVLFGSRAFGSHSPGSDVDIALYGDLGALEAESIRCDLDEMPFVHKFDVVAFGLLKNMALREHIERDGVAIYERAQGAVGGLGTKR